MSIEEALHADGQAANRPVPVLIAALALMFATSAAAQSQAPTVWQPTATRSVELFPAGDIYPVYVADPHRPTNQVAVGFYTRTRIPDSSSPRTMLSGGGRFGILRVGQRTAEGRSWQVSIDAGIDAMFDSQYKNDGIGWDGNYGLTVTTASTASPFSFKFAVLHCSAHLGDEYEERTDVPRLDYTREEVAVGIAWRARERTRVYGDIGLAYIMRSQYQERWRWQAGAEYEWPPNVFGGRMAWYTAADFSSLEERAWRLDTTLQAGLVTRSTGRTYRMYVQWYDGRPSVAQFTTYSEAYLSLGFKMDL